MKLNTLASHRAPYLRTSAEGGGGGSENGTTGGTTGGGGSTGATGPPDTGGSAFEAITSQEEFDKRISRRVNQIQSRFADYDTLKEKAQAFDALEAESRTEHERAAALAAEQAKADTANQYIPRLVATEFKVAAIGKLSDSQLEALLEDLDRSKYIGADGEPDVDKIKRKVTAVAGEKGGGRGKGPDLGQGANGGGGPRKGESGLAEAQRRYGKDKVPGRTI
jgi:hypothetical protein